MRIATRIARASSRPSLRVAGCAVRHRFTSACSYLVAAPVIADDAAQCSDRSAVTAGEIGGFALLPVGRADRLDALVQHARGDDAVDLDESCCRSCRTACRRRASTSRRPATPARATRWRRSRRRRDAAREQRTTPRARSRLRPAADCPSAPVHRDHRRSRRRSARRAARGRCGRGSAVARCQPNSSARVRRHRCAVHHECGDRPGRRPPTASCTCASRL